MSIGDYYNVSVTSSDELTDILSILNQYAPRDALSVPFTFFVVYAMYFGVLVSLYFMFSSDAEIVVFLFLAFIAFFSQLNIFDYILINKRRLLFHKLVVALPKFSEPSLQSFISEMDRYFEKWDPEEKKNVFSFSLNRYEQYKESFIDVVKREGEK